MMIELFIGLVVSGLLITSLVVICCAIAAGRNG